jgi:hypothetical protein
LAKTTNHASKCKKVYEAEAVLKDKGHFVFRRTSPHGLFHVVAFKDGVTTMVQVLRVKKFNFTDVNNELVKIQDFIESGHSPEQTDWELWVWVNHRGWVKYFFSPDGEFHKYEDYGNNHFRKAKN